MASAGDIGLTVLELRPCILTPEGPVAPPAEPLAEESTCDADGDDLACISFLF